MNLDENQTYEGILSAMQERYRALTGSDPDSASDIGIRLRVLADQMAALYRRVEEAGRQVFPQTSTGAALDRHAAVRGLARKTAAPAEGTLRFTREIPATADIAIPAGVICTTREPPVRFETSQAGVLPAGETAVSIPARAVDLGKQGNVAAGAVCLLVGAAPGITGVGNPAAFAGGLDEEEDEALRTRLLGAYRNISNGTNAAYYYDIAMQHESVESVNVIPRKQGRGTVDVVLGCVAGATGSVVANALNKIFREDKEINVDVRVYPAGSFTLDVHLAIAPEEGHNLATVTQAVTDRVKSYVDGLGVAKPLLLARLLREVLAVEGVYNARVIAPTTDQIPAEDRRLRLSACQVERLADG